MKNENEKITKENCQTYIELEFEYLKKLCIESKIYPLIVIGKNFNTDGETVLCNPNLNSQKSKVAYLEFILEKEKELLKKLN